MQVSILETLRLVTRADSFEQRSITVNLEASSRLPRPSLRDVQVSIQEIPRLVARCRESGPLSESALSDEELQLFDAMLGRMFDCAEAAAQVP